MAFTYCTNCGEKIDYQAEKCPFCGYVRTEIGGQTPTVNQQFMPQVPTQNPQNPQNPAGYNQGNSQYGSNPNNPYGTNPNNPYGTNQGSYGSPNLPNMGGAFVPPQMPKRTQRPTNQVLVILSIINFLLGSCCGLGLLFGIPALYYAAVAKNTPLDEDAKKFNKVAFVLNIIGIIVSIVTIVIFIVILAINMNNPEFVEKYLK